MRPICIMQHAQPGTSQHAPASGMEAKRKVHLFHSISHWHWNVTPNLDEPVPTVTTPTTHKIRHPSLVRRVRLNAFTREINTRAYNRGSCEASK